MRVTIAAPATSANLGPGFDILACALDLQNEVAAETVESGGITITVHPPLERLRDPAQNLVAQAYTSACADLGVPTGSLHLRCTNRIPMGAGLGSSAAAALSGVLVASALHAAPWDADAILARVAAIEGHRDNAAACLHGGLTICTSESTARLDLPDSLRAVVVIPEQAVATELARSVLPTTLPRGDAVFNASRCALLVWAVATGNLDALGIAMEDCWHQPSRTALMPALPQLIEAARSSGAHGAALSGAGPSVVALATEQVDAVAAALTARASELGVAARVEVFRLRNWGARVTVAP